MVLKVRVDETLSKSIPRISKNLTTISQGSGSSIPSKLVDWGYWFAVSKAPHFSGATKRAIRKVKTKKGAKLELIQPTQPNRREPRPYHLWMHGIRGNISSHIKSGDPKFMFTTAKAMEKRALMLTDKEVRKALKK